MIEMPPVTFSCGRLRVRFDRFDIPAYRRFLQVKALPESDVEFDADTEAYTVTAPRRFATMLDVQAPPADSDDLPLEDWLFDDQRFIVPAAIEAKRYACWSDCGLGKTLIALSYSRQVMHRTGGRVLIVTLNDVVDQFSGMCREFYGNSLPMVRLRTRHAMRCFCLDGTTGRDTKRTEAVEHLCRERTCQRASKELAAIKEYRERLNRGELSIDWTGWAEFTVPLSNGTEVDVLWDPSHMAGGHLQFWGPISETGYRSHFMAPCTDATLPEFAREMAEELAFKLTSPKKGAVAPKPPSLAITNYEKFNPEMGSTDKQVITELRHLAGLVLDESSRLKTGGGKQKWAIIKSSKGIEYKLSCTATPAPNDTMEFASQAAFLERMRTDGDIIWTYFHRDQKTHRWTVKAHAREAFFRFMSSWSIYVRDTRRYGWRKDHKPIPDPITTIHDVAATPEQILEMQKLSTDPTGQMRLFEGDTNAIQRVRLSEVAKGFLYEGPEKPRVARRIPSRKPVFVADLIQRDREQFGEPVLCWTQFDAETDILADLLRERGLPFDVITGRVKKSLRGSIIDRFRNGETPILIGRAKMLGYGQNFQHCGCMVFSGWNDSFEEWYQAIRRAFRFGKETALRVHVPVVRELEGDMLENVFNKAAKHLAAIEEMEHYYIEAMREMRLVA